MDTSTVKLLLHPIKTSEDLVTSLKQGYADGKETTGKIVDEAGIIYEKSNNWLDEKGFLSNAEVRIQVAIQSGTALEFGSLDYFNNKVLLGTEGLYFNRDNKGEIQSIVERAGDGSGYDVYKYGDNLLNESLGFSLVNPDFDVSGKLTKEDYMNNTDFVFGVIKGVSEYAGIIKTDELFTFTVNEARSYFSDLQFSDQGQLNYTYAGIMNNLANEFDRNDHKITYGHKQPINPLTGGMNKTSSVDCTGFMTVGIHILGLNTGESGTPQNVHWHLKNEFDYSKEWETAPKKVNVTKKVEYQLADGVRLEGNMALDAIYLSKTLSEQKRTDIDYTKRIIELYTVDAVDNGPKNILYNDSVITRFTAEEAANLGDKTGMIGVTYKEHQRYKVGSEYKDYGGYYDHVYISLDEDARAITESTGWRNYGIYQRHDNQYLGQIKTTKYFLQLTLPENRESEEK